MIILKNLYDLKIEKGTKDSVGIDLPSPQDIFIAPRSHVVIDFGIVVEPHSNISFIALVPRSSLFVKKGLILGNSIGIIDPDYRGPEDTVKAILYNVNDYAVTIKKGERIVQLIELFYGKDLEFEEKEEATESRGGLGSTGE